MASAEDVEKWSNAINYFDSGELLTALETLQTMTKSARIEYNIGFIHHKLEEMQMSLQHFREATKRDAHFALAYFAIGLNYFSSGSYKDAVSNLEQAQKCLRNNKMVDYRQLGLSYQLTISEILLNIGVALSMQGKVERARGYLLKALECKTDKEYSIINDALDRLQTGYPLSPLQLPSNAIFRPPKAAVDNVKKRNYLGKAKVVFTAKPGDNTSGFSGLQMFKVGRQNLLNELRRAEKKASLKECRAPPRKPLPTLGRVVDKPNKPLPKRPVSVCVIPTCEPPDRNDSTSNLNPMRQELRSTSVSGRPAVDVQKDLGSEGALSRPVPERPPKPRSPAIVPKRLSAPNQMMDTDRKEDLQPKPAPRNNKTWHGQGIPNGIKASSNSLQLKLQFSFTSELHMEEDATLQDVVKQIRDRAVPNDIDLCYVDDLGRQRTLTERDWKELSVHQKKSLKILCFGK